MKLTNDFFDGDFGDSCLAREECIEEFLRDVAPGCLYCRLDDEDEY
ncbi:MAG TPA: hypothetical protein VEX68_12740 [Bryobacteraceae bacterium]|nr:hypothetical protein [Bryobacteraceae bacterium]